MEAEGGAGAGAGAGGAREGGGGGSGKFLVSLVGERLMRGPVYALAGLEGKLVAACDGRETKIQVFRWSPLADASTASAADTGLVGLGRVRFELKYECGFAGHILALYLRTTGSRILTGDLLRSLTLLQYEEKDGVGRLDEVTRDFSTNYMRCIEIMPPLGLGLGSAHGLGMGMGMGLGLGMGMGGGGGGSPGADGGRMVLGTGPGGTTSSRSAANGTGSGSGTGDGSGSGLYLGADESGNIFMLQEHAHDCPDEEKGRMVPVGEISVGDCINAMRPGTLSSQPRDTDAAAGFAGSAVIYGTVGGSVGNLIRLNEQDFQLLASLEHAIRVAVAPVGQSLLCYSSFFSFLFFLFSALLLALLSALPCILSLTPSPLPTPPLPPSLPPLH